MKDAFDEKNGICVCSLTLVAITASTEYFAFLTARLQLSYSGKVLHNQETYQDSGFRYY